MPGYHINWGNHELSQKKEEVKEIENQQHDDSYFLKLENKIENQKKKILTSTCDTIRLQDGSILFGQIIRQDSNVIEYKSCENESSFIYKIYKTRIKSITYSNGVVYEHKSEAEIKEKRKRIEEKHIEIINKKGISNEEEERLENTKNSNKAMFILFIGILISIFSLIFQSYLIFIGLFFILLAILILKIKDSKISEYDKTPIKNKIFEKNGNISILLFLFTSIFSIISYPIIIFAGFPLPTLFILAEISLVIFSLYLSIKSLKKISKNPDLYESRNLILFFLFFESLVLGILIYIASMVFSGNLHFSS
jgi:hypothetical protein